MEHVKLAVIVTALLPGLCQCIPSLGTVIQAEVISLTESEAGLSTGQSIAFDYAVVSTGCQYHDTFGNETSFHARTKGNKVLALTCQGVAVMRAIWRM